MSSGEGSPTLNVSSTNNNFNSPTIRLGSEQNETFNYDSNSNGPQSNISKRISQIPFLRPDSFIEESEEEDEDLDYERPSMNSLDQGLSLYRTQSPSNRHPQLFESPQKSVLYTPTLGSPSNPSSFAKGEKRSRYSMSGSAKSNPIYSLQNNSNPSINQQSSRHLKTSSSAFQYTPGPFLPPRTRSPKRAKSPVRLSNSPSRSPVRSSSPAKYQPFKFGSIMMNNSSENLSLNPNTPSASHGHYNTNSLSAPKASYRKGHRYKHSSVSMNMFQEPPKREPVNIPKTFIIPTSKDVVQSLNKSQKMKLGWAVGHVWLSFITYLAGFKFGNISLSTLSHLVFYDSIGNLLIISVQVLANFEVWNRSSLKYPFGLGRIEVLVGFGLSVSLMFVGIDLFSHLAEELVIRLVVGSSSSHDGEESHAHHVHENKGQQLNPFVYELFLLLIIIVTLVSSRVISSSTTERSEKTSEAEEEEKNRKPRMKRISSITLEEPVRANPVQEIKRKHSILNNSTSILTLIYAVYSMMYPVAHGTDYIELLNQSSTFILALLVLYFAWKLIQKLSNVLLLKKPFDQLESQILRNVESLEVYRSYYKIEHLLISKVNHKIFIIVMKIKMIGASDDDESKLRFYATKIVRSLVYQSLNGGIKTGNGFSGSADATTTDSRVSLVELLDVDSQFESMDTTGEQFEITIDVDRL